MLVAKQRNVGSRTQLQHSSAGEGNDFLMINVADQGILIEDDHSA